MPNNTDKSIEQWLKSEPLMDADFRIPRMTGKSELLTEADFRIPRMRQRGWPIGVIGENLWSDDTTPADDGESQNRWWALNFGFRG